MRVRTANPTSAENDTAETAGIDDLTGLLDETGFVACAKETFWASQEGEAPLTLAYFDFETDGTGANADSGVIPPILISMACKLREFYRATDILGRVGDHRLAALLAQYADDAVPVVEGVHAITEATADVDRLVLTIGMVHATPGGTLDQLMDDADLRIKEIRRRDSTTSTHLGDGGARVPAKHQKRRTRNSR